MSGAARYVPVPDGLHAEFYRVAASTGRLHLQRCRDCGIFRHPPRHYCPSCSSPAWDFVASSERGSVYSFTVTHRSFDPAWADETPFVTVAVELEEGPRVLGAARGLDPQTVQLGQPVRIEVEPHSEEFAFFWVEPRA